MKRLVDRGDIRHRQRLWAGAREIKAVHHQVEFTALGTHHQRGCLGTFEQLRADRSMVRGFTEEGLRMRSPTHGLSTRMTAHDEVFQGVEVPAGSLLHLRFGAANVDADEFDCPFDLELDRALRVRVLHRAEVKDFVARQLSRTPHSERQVTAHRAWVENRPG